MRHAVKIFFYEILFTLSVHLHQKKMDPQLVFSVLSNHILLGLVLHLPCTLYSLCHLSLLFFPLLLRLPSPPQSRHKLDGRQLSELSEGSLTAITRCVGIHVEMQRPALLISLSLALNGRQRRKQKSPGRVDGDKTGMRESERRQDVDGDRERNVGKGERQRENKRTR